MDIWDRLKDSGEAALDAALRAALTSDAGGFGIIPKPNQDPTAAQIEAGQLGQQPDSTIYERKVQDSSLLKNNFFNVGALTANPVAIVGVLIALAVGLALFVRGRK